VTGCGGGPVAVAAAERWRLRRRSGGGAVAERWRLRRRSGGGAVAVAAAERWRSGGGCGGGAVAGSACRRECAGRVTRGKAGLPSLSAPEARFTGRERTK